MAIKEKAANDSLIMKHNEMPRSPNEERRRCGMPQLPPEEMTIHMLIADISKITHDTIRREAAKLELGSSYRQLIFHIFHCNGITQQELARRAHLTPPSVSVALQKMELQGLIRRETDQSDMRQVKVYLSEKGVQIDEKIHEKFVETEKIMIEGLSQEEIFFLQKILVKIRANVIDNSEDKNI